MLDKSLSLKQQKEAVQGVVFSPDKTGVLLTQRRDIPVWVLPGGGLDAGETPEEGVIREILEETGCHAEIIRKVAEYLPVNRMTEFTHLFECRWVSGSPQATEETKQVRFFPLTSLPPMPPPYLSWIEDTQQNLPHLIRKKISGVNYWVLFKLFVQHPLLVGRYLLKLLKII